MAWLGIIKLIEGVCAFIHLDIQKIEIEHCEEENIPTYGFSMF